MAITLISWVYTKYTADPIPTQGFLSVLWSGPKQEAAGMKVWVVDIILGVTWFNIYNRVHIWLWGNVIGTLYYKLTDPSFIQKTIIIAFLFKVYVYPWFVVNSPSMLMTLPIHQVLESIVMAVL
jgi:hypothetical protein